MKLNQRGFGLVEGLLVMVIIGIIGAVGYYVYKVNNESNKSGGNSSEIVKSNEEEAAEPEDESASWKEISSASGAFSLKVPDGWKLNNDPDRDLIRSASQDPDDLKYEEGAAALISQDVTPAADIPYSLIITTNETSSKFEGQTSSQFVLNNGVSGVKLYIEQDDLLGGTGLMKNASYEFKKDGKYFIAHYTIFQGDPDYTEIVEKAIKTLQF